MTGANHILVSYLVPCFNHEKFVLAALESILKDAATINDSFEILIADDGSTDESKAHIDRWISQNSKFKISFFKNENQGVSKSLNFLVTNASGKFLRVMASDDLLIPGSTTAMIAELSKHQSTLAVCGDVETIGDHGELIAKSHLKFQSKPIGLYQSDLKRAIISKWGLSGPAILLRSSFVSDVGTYDPDLIIEDWNMYMRLAAANKLIFSNGPVAQYRIHTRNTSRTNDRSKKIKNLSNQVLAGEKCLTLFKGPYFWALKSEIELLKAKVSFLNSNFVATGWRLIRFISFQVLAKMTVT